MPYMFAGLFFLQVINVTGLNESEVYTFTLTANNQVGESNVNASILIMTNESCKCAVEFSLYTAPPKCNVLTLAKELLLT